MIARRTLAAVVASVALLGLSACNSSGEENAVETSSPVSTSTTPAPAMKSPFADSFYGEKREKVVRGLVETVKARGGDETVVRAALIASYAESQWTPGIASDSTGPANIFGFPDSYVYGPESVDAGIVAVEEFMDRAAVIPVDGQDPVSYALAVQRADPLFEKTYRTGTNPEVSYPNSTPAVEAAIAELNLDLG